MTRDQANPGSSGQKLEAFNKNSKYRGDDFVAYALFYSNSRLNAHCADNPPVGGAIAFSGGFVSDGTPIQIDFSQLGPALL